MLNFLFKWLFPPLGVTIKVTPERTQTGSISYKAEAVVYGKLFYTYSWSKRQAIQEMKAYVKRERVQAKIIEAGSTSHDV